MNTAAVEPFTVGVPDAVLEDLRTRLRATRWPEKETVDDWSQGVPMGYLREVCEYWAESYDWRARERALNRFAQYRIAMDGVNIHFVHVRSPEIDALPLLITHGWPGSVVEFLKVIEPLTDPAAHGGAAADAFHVVCPTLPGYPLSGKPVRPGWTVEKIASTWAELMGRLGYPRYGAQGGDWGSSVTTAIGSTDPEHCVGIQVTMPIVAPRTNLSPETLSDDERAAVAARAYFERWDSGYSRLQASRPQTLGYALTDSPAGQAAWILEKFWAWTDCDGHPENAVSRDELLDNVTLYWVTAAAASSARLYWESFPPRLPPVEIPAAVASFPKDILRVPESWARSTYRNLVRWTDLPRGGHFAAMEQPELLVEEIRAFFRARRQSIGRSGS